MKPVFQTKFGYPSGNCFAACVASILELPLEDVPCFEDIPGDGTWWHQVRDWAKTRGLTAFYYVPIDVDTNERIRIPFDQFDQADVPKGYCILTGKSPHGDWDHCVVALDGKPVFDPHGPDAVANLENIVDWIYFQPIEA